MEYPPGKSTDGMTLESQMLDRNVPKTEREHWAVEKIAAHAAKLDKAVEALQEIDNIAGAWPLSEGNEDSLGLLEMCGKVSVKALALLTAKSERNE